MKRSLCCFCSSILYSSVSIRLFCLFFLQYIFKVCRASIVMSEFNDCNFCSLNNYFILLCCLFFVCVLSSRPVFWADVIVWCQKMTLLLTNFPALRDGQTCQQVRYEPFLINGWDGNHWFHNVTNGYITHSVRHGDLCFLTRHKMGLASLVIKTISRLFVTVKSIFLFFFALYIRKRHFFVKPIVHERDLASPVSQA